MAIITAHEMRNAAGPQGKWSTGRLIVSGSGRPKHERHAQLGSAMGDEAERGATRQQDEQSTQQLQRHNGAFAV